MMYHYLREHYGDVASVAGLVISIVGFVVTIIAVRKAGRAAEGARRAARDAIARFGAQHLSNELGTVLQLVREIDAACRDRNRVSVTFRCDEPRTRLAQLQESKNFQAEELQALREAADDFHVIIKEVVKVQLIADEKDLPPKVSKSLHELILFLSRVKGRLQSVTTEV